MSNVGVGIGGGNLPTAIYGIYKFDINATKTKAELIDLAVGHGARYTDGSLVTAGNAVLVEIDVALKAATAQGDISDENFAPGPPAFVATTATAADARVLYNGGSVNLDPQDLREAKDPNTYDGIGFEAVEIIAVGSIVTGAMTLRKTS